jgi:hypothetical protein
MVNNTSKIERMELFTKHYKLSANNSPLKQHPENLGIRQ